MILVVFIAVCVAPEDLVQNAAEDLVLQRGDEKLELMPQGHGNRHGVLLLYAPTSLWQATSVASWTPSMSSMRVTTSVRSLMRTS